MNAGSCLRASVLVLAGLVGGASLHAQDAKQIVQKAVEEELTASQNDHSHWRYREERKDQNDSVYLIVETSHGTVKKLVERGGTRLSQSDDNAEQQRVENFIQSPSQL